MLFESCNWLVSESLFFLKRSGKSWKSQGISRWKLCGNPVKVWNHLCHSEIRQIKNRSGWFYLSKSISYEILQNFSYTENLDVTNSVSFCHLDCCQLFSKVSCWRCMVQPAPPAANHWNDFHYKVYPTPLKLLVGLIFIRDFDVCIMFEWKGLRLSIMEGGVAVVSLLLKLGP